MTVYAEWLLVATNAFFIIPSIKAWSLEHTTYSILYFIMIFASSFHHACIGGINCVLPPTIARKTDFFFAQLLIPMSALYLIQVPQAYAKLKRVLIWFFMVALFVVEVFLDEPFWMQVVIVGVSIGMLVVYWIIYASYYALNVYRGPKDACGGNCLGFRFPPYNWLSLSLGFWLSIWAVCLFGPQGRWPGFYDLIHALWHTLAALGQYWILDSRKAAPAWALIDSNIIEHQIKSKEI